MPRYYVSGVIQIEVVAKDETEAMKKAETRAWNMMKLSPTINIGIDPDAVEEKTT